ncbi:hypothetical protein ACS0TY_026889 [Phlomoides rotata]
MDDDVELVVAILTMFGLIAALFIEMNDTILMLSQGFLLLRSRISNGSRLGGAYSVKSKISRQLDSMHYLINDNDVTCRDHIRMNSDCFNRCCYLLQNLRGLRPTRNVSISEQLAIFLTILSHHTKNRVVKHTFRRSGYTISKHFNNVLNTLLRLYTVLLITPTPVPEDSTDNRWRYFKDLEDFGFDFSWWPSNVRLLHPDLRGDDDAEMIEGDVGEEEVAAGLGETAETGGGDDEIAP